MSAYTKSIKTKKTTNVLDKVVKKNPKYAHIESTIDTGSSVTRYLKKLEEIKTNYRYQQNEIFRRIKISTFIQLVLQIANIDAPFDDTESNYSKRDKAAALSSVPEDDDLTARPSDYGYPRLLNIINGVGEQDILRGAAPKPKVVEKSVQQGDDLPYLLLDIRDRDEYGVCHIKTALNYPVAMLSRSINNETKELLAYKNQEGKIIVVYDEDEKVATRAATTLVERGYDNLFMLSGGLKLAFKKFPEGLVVGKMPAHLITKEVGGKSNKAGATNVNEPSSTDSQNFESSDLEKLNDCLENTLLQSDASSRLSSRTSRASTTGDRRSVYSSNSLISQAPSIHSQPWKPT